MPGGSSSSVVIPLALSSAKRRSDKSRRVTGRSRGLRLLDCAVIVVETDRLVIQADAKALKRLLCIIFATVAIVGACKGVSKDDGDQSSKVDGRLQNPMFIRCSE